MKVFRILLNLMLIAMSVYTGYFAFVVYKASLAYTIFGLVLCCTLVVLLNGGLSKDETVKY